MESLLHLTKTEKLTTSARIIENKLIDVLKRVKADKSVVEKQQQINKNVEDFLIQTGNIDSFTDEEFVAKLLEMCSIFKNAHISLNYSKFLYNDGKRFLSQNLFYFNDKIYLAKDDQLLEVKSIGGWQTEKICKEFDKYLSYETKEWRNVQLNKMLNFVLLYEVLGIDYGNIELMNGQVLNCSTSEIFFDDYSYLPPFKSRNEKFYDCTVLDNHILLIDYFSCSELHKGDFLKFLEDVKEKWKNSQIDSFIIDIRGNRGGDSELILPLFNFLKEKKLKGVILTDNRVFSSGTFVAYYAKHMLSSMLIGQTLGQGAIRFGQSSGQIILDDKLFIRYTEKYFDFRDIFKNEGAIKPDIEVPLTIEDICSKTDKTLAYAKNYIQNTLLNAKENW